MGSYCNGLSLGPRRSECYNPLILILLWFFYSYTPGHEPAGTCVLRDPAIRQRDQGMGCGRIGAGSPLAEGLPQEVRGQMDASI